MKYLLALFLTAGLLQAYCVPYSLVSNSGSKDGYDDLDDYLEEQNDKIKEYWKKDIKEVIEDIEEESEKRKEKLEKLTNLEKERLFVTQQIEFLLKQEAELLGNLADIESEVNQ